MSMPSTPGLLLPKNQCRHNAALNIIGDAEPNIGLATYTLNRGGRQL